MITALDNYYMLQDEPNKSCLLALSDVVKGYDERINAEYRWALPFFKYRSKSFCYLNVEKASQRPYISVYLATQVDHPILFSGGRKIFSLIYIDPLVDIPVEQIYEVFDLVRDLHDERLK